MVRLKNRYLLLELITEDGRSDDGLNGKLLLDVFRDAIGTIHGDYGLGACQHSLKGKTERVLARSASARNCFVYAGTLRRFFLRECRIAVLYVNAPTQIAVARCNRDFHTMLWSSLTLITTVRKRPCIVRCVHLSGVFAKALIGHHV